MAENGFRSSVLSMWTPEKPNRHAIRSDRGLVVAALALIAMALVMTACGSSSKPEYCSDVSSLEGSVEELKGVELQSGALATLEADLKNVQTDANEVVSSAKQDFPNETSAVRTSVTGLSTATQGLAAAPTPQELAVLAASVKSVASAAEELASATESACG